MTAEWYIRSADGSEGPYDLDTIRGFVRAGVIDRRTDVGLRTDGPWFAAETTEIFREGASSAAPRTTTHSSPPGKARAVVILVLLAVGVWATWHLLRPDGFTDADIEATREAIRQEYGSRVGVVVTDVTLLRSSARRLDGFARATFFGVPQVVNCSASMADDSHKYVWQCQ